MLAHARRPLLPLGIAIPTHGKTEASETAVALHGSAPLALRIPPGDSPYLPLNTHFRPFFIPNFGSIFDVVCGFKMDHFWNPKYAKMSPNGDP